MLEIKNTIAEMKNAFDGLFTRLDTAEEEKKISELPELLGSINRNLQN